MIILEKDGLKMVVSTELQAAAFTKNGYVRVKAEKQVEPEQKPVAVEESPKRRRRKASSNAE